MFTALECEYLLEVLEIEQQGLYAAQETTEQDRTLGTVEDLCELLTIYHQKLAMLDSIREKVQEQDDSRSGANTSYSGYMGALLSRLRCYAGRGHNARHARG